MLILLISFISLVSGGTVTDNAFKDQFCTDPRTMQKHAAYTEWADAYSCTRHRCQPGGRNLAIYTVGCKRVEAPESAIECEEVVEDTNMQFPYCCTRLRCLVVVRGEVWTRVLGQPWETLPAAPWSHMYKMKKPPPGEGSTLPKSPSQGPIYELTESFSDNENKDKSVRTKNKIESDYEPPKLRSSSPKTPDIVIALSTDNDMKTEKKMESNRFGHLRKSGGNSYVDDEADHRADDDDTQVVTEKEHHAWTEIPSNQWNEHEVSEQESAPPKERNEIEKPADKPTNLQALVDAIGTRMRDIEHVVQKMTEKVHHPKPGDPDFVSAEKRAHSDSEVNEPKEGTGKEVKIKVPNPDDHYKSQSKYLHNAVDTTTDQPLFVEDTNMNGYFSDASNSVIRRSSSPQEPALTYMAPVETRRKGSHSDTSEEVEKKHKKRAHKHKKSRFGKNHKKHKGKEEKKTKFKSASSAEVTKNTVSLEDSSGVINK